MFSIGDVSKRSGVHIETIRYYERTGLVPKPRRSTNGRRHYDERALARFVFIRRARDLGFTLSDICSLLALEESDATCRQAHALATRHRDAIRSKIRELRQLDRRLSQTTRLCTQMSAASCPVIEALSDGLQ